MLLLLQQKKNQSIRERELYLNYPCDRNALVIFIFMPINRHFIAPLFHNILIKGKVIY